MADQPPQDHPDEFGAYDWTAPTPTRTKRARPAGTTPDDHEPTAAPTAGVLIDGIDYRLIHKFQFAPYVFERRSHQTDHGTECIHILSVWKGR